MPECIIADTVVKFPFEPYDVQRAYMEKVILCLRDSTNGVLESPTGTGKTLSLLCSSLAWLLSKKEEMKSTIQTTKPNSDDNKNEIKEQKVNRSGSNIPKIIYASRTHSQLAQAMQELKRTSYSFMKAVVLGSRDQLCIHPEVMKEQENANKIQMCKFHVLTKKCSFLSRLESCKTDSDFCASSIMDIEDLVKVGQKLKMCPYFASKQLVEEADIVFMPYNYLFDRSARQGNKIQMSNAICILDEAHNIEKICEESASTQIKSTDVAMAIEDIIQVVNGMRSGKIDVKKSNLDIELNDLFSLQEILLKLAKSIDNIEVLNKKEGATFPAAYIFELLAQANINFSSSNIVIELLDKLVQLMVIESQNNHLLRKGGSFQKFANLLTTVFNCDEESMDKVHRSFKVHVQIEEPKQLSSHTEAYSGDAWLWPNKKMKTKPTIIVNYWCFNPGFGMEQLLNTNPRSVILTSGTLAPLTPLIAELCLPVAHRLENPHIVPSSNVYCKMISSGPDHEQLISNYQNRDNPKYINSLGSTILNVARVVPDGLLVFFPSYPLLNQCVNSWRASGLWADILRYKPTFIEPRGKDDFLMTMESFYDNINLSKGACFMAVCRGKVSEGLDFVDRNGRAVIITGLPFPPLKDPKIILKRKYLEENRTKENELLSGAAWYSLEATRAVNQAIGRVIRHRNDYGAILLCDIRFQQPSQVKQLSKWIRDILGSAPKSTAFGAVVKELRDFFKNAEKTVSQNSEVELLMSNDFQVDVTQNKYFSDCKETLRNEIKFQNDCNENNVHNEIIVIDDEAENSIPSWSPNSVHSKSSHFQVTEAAYSLNTKDKLKNENKYKNIHNEINIIEENKCTIPDAKEICENKLQNIHNIINIIPSSEPNVYAEHSNKNTFDEIGKSKYQNCRHDDCIIKIELPASPYDDVETSISDHFLYSKYVADSDETIDKEDDSVISSPPTSIAGQSCYDNLSSDMNVKSSLNKDDTAIDTCLILPSCSNGLQEASVKISKRDQSVLSQSKFTISTSSEAINTKKIKLDENLSLNPSMIAISPPLSSYSHTQKQRLDNKTIPEGRVEFLNLLREILSPPDFADFTAALMHYKHNDTINNLLDLLFRLFGQTELLYLLHSMRRFLRVQHRPQFDKRIADLCCIYNDDEFQSIPIYNPFTCINKKF